MKVLKIENEKCFYSIDGKKYFSIVDIGKDDIYNILDLIYKQECEFDECNDDTKIKNDVEKIIYKDLFIQLDNFKKNVLSLKQEIDDEFKDAYEKYDIKDE